MGEADSAIADAMESARKLAVAQDGTIIVHLIVEEEDGAMRRRLTTRDLNEEEEQAQYQEKITSTDGDTTTITANGSQITKLFSKFNTSRSFCGQQLVSSSSSA